MTSMDVGTSAKWEPVSVTESDCIDLGRVTRLASSIGLDEVPSTTHLLPMWHVLAFLGPVPRSETGPDGHRNRGGFLPPLPQRRRMFAGGTVRFHSPIPLDTPLTRVGVVAGVESKRGQSGPLTLVSIDYETRLGATTFQSESQTLVYSDGAPRPRQPADTPSEAPWHKAITLDEVDLFRFSALTFNSHRIHYDRSYATKVDGYPDLVVHGPLLALLLAELAREHRPDPMSRFDYRIKSPVFANEEVTLLGAPVDHVTSWLRAQTPDGVVAAEATVAYPS